jgi:hypothetical protein
MQCVAYDHTFSRDIEERHYSRLKLEREEDELKKQNSTKSTTTTANSSAVSSIKGEADVADSVLNASEPSYVSPSTSPQPEPLRRSQRKRPVRNRWRVQSSNLSGDEDVLHGFRDIGKSDDGNETDGGLSYVDSD